MPKKTYIPIKYTARDFQSIKDSLVEYARRYYPDTFKDFNEASFGSLMLDTVAYVGDIMSFYLDYQANESFLDTAIEYKNIVKLSKQLGYKYQSTPSSTGEVAFHVLIPANSAGTAPDTDYYPILLRGSSMVSEEQVKYILVEDVDFSNPKNEIVVARTDSVTGSPTFYAVKAYGKVISGELVRQDIDVGTYTKFRRVELLEGENVSEVMQVVDSDGQEYFEVDYLSQDVVYKEFKNPNTTDRITAPKIIKPVVVPRRFTVDREPGRTFLQFGFGSESDLTSDEIVDPTKVLLEQKGKTYITDISFDPYNFTTSDKFGVSPTNTTLQIVYRINSAENSNAPVGSITTPVDSAFFFTSEFDLDAGKVAEVRRSLDIINETPILGDLQFRNVDHLKARAYGAFYSQNRAVTAQDYKTLTYSMDPKFGSVKRCNIVLDQDSFKRNLNLYVISQNFDGTLEKTNNSIKENLKTWLNKYKMLSDTIDILDARIINLGIDFSVLSEEGINKAEILQRCFVALEDYFEDMPEIGEPLQITKIYNILNNVPGVVDTFKLDIYQKFGDEYSDTFFNIKENMSADGRYIIIPKNVIYEIKYINDDIRGVIK
jgi:hypothetical protein